MYILISSRSIADGNDLGDSTLGLVNVLGQFEKIDQCVDTAIKDMGRIMREQADRYVHKVDIEGYNDFMSTFDKEIFNEDLIEFDKEGSGQAYLGELVQNMDDYIDQTDYFVYKI